MDHTNNTRSEDSARTSSSRIAKRYVLLLLVFSTLISSILAVHDLITDIQLLGFLLPVAIILTLSVPIIVGYNDGSFTIGVLVGVLPSAGAYVSIFARYPLSTRIIESITAAALAGTALVLPFVSVLFVVGVGLRRNGTLTDQIRGYALRIVTATILTVFIIWILDTGLVDTYGLQ